MFHTIKNKKKGQRGSYALKLDMTKACDGVEWSFLKAMMVKMGFYLKWIYIIMRCITSISYTIIINCSISNTFQPVRGLRQGDTMSPYLFLISTEGLSAFLDKHQRNELRNGIQASCNGPRVTHLFFVDDSIQFANANGVKK